MNPCLAGVLSGGLLLSPGPVPESSMPARGPGMEHDAASQQEDDPARVAWLDWKRVHGKDGYRYHEDASRKLLYAVALTDRSWVEVQAMVGQLADYLALTLFEGTPGYDICILVPAAEHAAAILGEDRTIGGHYDHARHRVVSRSTGESLRHELVHALHFAHMEHLRLPRAHPTWIQEGLATLYEQYEWCPDGAMRILPSQRTTIVKNLQRAGRLIPWDSLMSMDEATFSRMSSRAYPEVRLIFEYLTHQDLLETWYMTCSRADHATRTPGRDALESTSALSLDEIEKEWKTWVQGQSGIPLVVEIGTPWLGFIPSDEIESSGIRIDAILPGSGRRLRSGDIILAAGGREVRSVAELIGVLAGYRNGDRIEIRLRRGHRTITTRLLLRPFQGSGPAEGGV